jgi:hypothetical protein
MLQKMHLELTGGTNTKHASPPNMDSHILYLNEFQKIPLLTTKMLNKKMLNDNHFQLSTNYDQYEIINDPQFKSLFALISSNNALSFRFGASSTLIFHTSITPEDGDFVIAYLKEKNLFVYRDLKIINNKFILIPLDADIYKEITLCEHDCIVAVLYETRIKIRPDRVL